MDQRNVARRDRDDATIVELAGELDLANVDQVGREIYDAMEDAVDRRLVLDLSAVAFLDSSTVNLVFRLQAHSRMLNTALHLVAPSGSRAARVLTVAGTRAVIPVAQSIDEAMAKMQRGEGSG